MDKVGMLWLESSVMGFIISGDLAGPEHISVLFVFTFSIVISLSIWQ